MPVAEKTALTVAEFLERPDCERFELIDGELVEQSMNPESVWVACKIYRLLDDACLPSGSAVALGDGVGFSLGEHSEHEFRKPDASVVLKSRLPKGWLSAPVFEFAPDLAVEVVSPTDVMSHIERKIHEYLAAGTQLVWLARPSSRRIQAFHADGTEKTYGPNDVIDAGFTRSL